MKSKKSFKQQEGLCKLYWFKLQYVYIVSWLETLIQIASRFTDARVLTTNLLTDNG